MPGAEQGADQALETLAPSFVTKRIRYVPRLIAQLVEPSPTTDHRHAAQRFFNHLLAQYPIRAATSTGQALQMALRIARWVERTLWAVAG